jgi:hypothetical protein
VNLQPKQGGGRKPLRVHGRVVLYQHGASTGFSPAAGHPGVGSLRFAKLIRATRHAAHPRRTQAGSSRQRMQDFESGSRLFLQRAANP